MASWCLTEVKRTVKQLKIMIPISSHYYYYYYYYYYTTKLNPKNFKFKLKQVFFVGHKVTENGLIIDDSKIRALCDMPVPTDKKGVQRLLGMCNFLSYVVTKLSEIFASLREISIMNAEFCWSASQQTAFTHIKDYECPCVSIL